jgi:hypothetical protein
MKLIYDAAFASSTGSQPEHLGEFWWKDDYGRFGKWNSREEAHDYVAANPGTVEAIGHNNSTAIVLPYHHTNNPVSRWIQTKPDGTKEDNLITLAKNHR